MISMDDHGPVERRHEGHDQHEHEHEHDHDHDSARHKKDRKDRKDKDKDKDKKLPVKKKKIRLAPVTTDASDVALVGDGASMASLNPPVPIQERPLTNSPSGVFEVIANTALGKPNGKFDRHRLIQVLSSPQPHTQMGCMSFYFEDEIIEAHGFEDLKSPTTIQKLEKQVFWLDVVGYDPIVISSLSKIFGFHPLTVEDILNDESREKCELFEDYTFVCMRALVGYDDEQSFLTEVVYVVCCENYVISFHLNEVNNIKDIRQRLKRLTHVKLSAGWILYAILDNIVDAYIPVGDMLEMESTTIDELVFILSEKDQGDVLRRIAKARRQLTNIQKLISNKVEIFQQLRTRQQKFQRSLFSKEVFLYLEDVNSHVEAMEQVLSANQEVLTRAHSNYLAKISIELTMASNHMGSMMKKFSSGACIFLPLTLISGIMGMNVRVPGNLGSEEDREYWFYVILGIMAVMAILLVVIGMKKKWFS